MYERRKTLLSDVLFDSEGFADVLNRKEYIIQIEQYDKEMMDEYSDTCKKVEDNKAMLEADMNMLDTYQKEIKEKQENVSVYVDNTVKAISMYSGQIKEAERTADAYARQSAAEEADIAALKRKLAEEIAMSKLASQSEWRTIGDVTFEEGDRYLLANLIYCEAGNQPYEGQLAVGAVVINRLLSSVYPNTVVGVIYQRKQFSPVLDGHLAIALAQDKATENCYKAADEAMSGKTNVGGCVYFRTPIEGLTGIQIGGHIFY